MWARMDRVRKSKNKIKTLSAEEKKEEQLLKLVQYPEGGAH